MRIPFTSRATPMRRTGLAACGLVLALVLAGCSRETSDAGADARSEEDRAAVEEAATDAAGSAGHDRASSAPLAPPPPPPAAPQPLPGTDAIIVSQESGPAAADPDFDARGFAGTYSGGTTRLDIGAEGQFVLDDSGQVLTGTWTLQPGAKTIVLDPDVKGDADRLLQLEPDGSVRIDGGAALRRQ